MWRAFSNFQLSTKKDVQTSISPASRVKDEDKQIFLKCFIQCSNAFNLMVY